MATPAQSSDEKLVILKPLVWNAGGYLGPAGSRSVGGFVSENGYGHEEWNGDPEREWNGFRIFHTETKGRMDDFATDARLGMIMTAYRPKVGPVALGIATSVQANSPKEMAKIAKALRIHADGERIKEQEIAVSPRHHDLQSRFKAYISCRSTKLAENRRGVDLQYVCASRGLVLVEVKPCEIATTRFAIRTALGQLLDYRQSVGGPPCLLIVLELAPPEERDIQLALSNGVGIAWPKGRGFDVRWPTAVKTSLKAVPA